MLRGARLVPEALRLLLRERSLWWPAGVPFLLSILAVGGSLVAIFANAPEFWSLVAGWIPDPVADRWFEWLWVAPLDLLRWLAGAALFVAGGAVALVASLLLAGLLAAPFHEILSQRVERIETGAVVDRSPSIPVTVLNEARRLASFLLVQAGALVVAVVVPPLGALVFAAVTIVFLPLEYGSFVLDRRHVPFRRRRAWLRERGGLALGFGAASFALLALPVVNLVALPLFVVAGTLLALRHPPKE